jgi:hypothetical protein
MQAVLAASISVPPTTIALLCAASVAGVLELVGVISIG